MHASRALLAALAAAAALLCAAVPAAHAGTVLRVDGSKATRVTDPSVPSRGAADLGRMPAGPPVAGTSQKTKPKKKGPTRGEKAVDSALKTALRRRSISRKDEASYRKTYRLARSRRDRLSGQRKKELGYVVSTLEAIALRRQLTASRMKPLFLIVQRNAQFWLRSPFPGSRGYVQFKGSQMLFEYYVGEGLQLQPLANFKKANALHGACVKPTGVACNRAALTRLLDEMVATRVRRGKFIAWEYYFAFGGPPPWISGMATATGIQAFGRAGQLLNTGKWRTYVNQALPAFTTRAPTGVLTRGPMGGNHYLQYSFAPRLYIINALLQSVIGLYDYAEITGDPTAARLWRAAEPEARKELPVNDTGDWSTYSYRGRESTREYYDLLLEVAAGMCHRTKIEQYCTTTKNFRNYLSKPATLTFLGPTTATKGQETQVRFSVDKLSAVQIVITHENGKTALDKTATFRRGTGSFTFKPGATGAYTVRLAAKEQRTGKGLRTQATGDIESQ
jgi:hypothetical protein